MQPSGVQHGVREWDRGLGSRPVMGLGEVMGVGGAIHLRAALDQVLAVLGTLEVHLEHLRALILQEVHGVHDGRDPDEDHSIIPDEFDVELLGGRGGDGDE